MSLFYPNHRFTTSPNMTPDQRLALDRYLATLQPPDDNEHVYSFCIAVEYEMNNRRKLNIEWQALHRHVKGWISEHASVE